MATFAKYQVLEQGSLENFAKWAECYKVYRLPNNHDFIAIRSAHDEQAMFGSQHCRGAELVYERGRIILFDWNSLLLETRQFYGRTEEDAKAALQGAGISPDTIREIKVTRQVQSKISEGTHSNEDEAIKAAKAHVPSEAFDVGEATIRVFTGESGAVDIQAQNEELARQQWKTIVSENRKISKEAILDKLESITIPQNGLFGIGRKPGEWKAHWSVPFTAQISYKLPLEITVTYMNTSYNSKHPNIQEPAKIEKNYSGYSKAVIYCRAGFNISSMRLPGFTGDAEVLRSDSAVEEAEIIAAMLLKGCDKDNILLSVPDYGVGFIK